MGHVIQPIILSGMLALAASAQKEDMTMFMSCSDFVALNPEGRITAVEALHKAAGEMAYDRMTPAQIESANESVHNAAESKTLGDKVSAVLQACKGAPEMMLMDAMMEVSGD